MGLRQKVQREMLDSALPDDLKQEFHRLSEWAHTLSAKFGERVTLRVVDAASIEGFFKSLWRWFHVYPAFTVGDRRYVGADFARVDSLIAAELAAPRQAASIAESKRPEKGE